MSRLNHACSVVAHGRTFLRRLINLLRYSKRHQKFLRSFFQCGTAYLFSISPTGHQSPTSNSQLTPGAVWVLVLITRANGSAPRSCPLNNLWEWPIKNCTYPILIACHIWGPKSSRKRVLFHCDNESVVHIIKSDTSKDDYIMYLVRALFLIP